MVVEDIDEQIFFFFRTPSIDESLSQQPFYHPVLMSLRLNNFKILKTLVI